MSKLQIFIPIFVLLLLLFTQSSYAQVEFAYVTNFDTGTLSVINTQTNVITDQIPVSSSTQGLAINSECSIAYVVNRNDNGVSAVNLGTNSVIDTLTFDNPENPNDIVITPDGSTLYVDGINKIIVIDASTFSVVTEIPFPGTPETLAITPDGSKIYTAFSNNYSVVNTATNTVITTVVIPPPLIDVNEFTVSPDGQRAYLTDFMANVSGISGIVISTATDQIIENMPFVGITPATVNFVPDGSKAYVPLNNSNMMAEYNPVSNTFPDTFFTGNAGIESAFTMDGLRGYLTLFVPDEILVFDTTTNTVINTILSPGDGPSRVEICAPRPLNVPAISHWGIIALVGLFAVAAVIFMRRRAVA